MAYVKDLWDERVLGFSQKRAVQEDLCVEIKSIEDDLLPFMCTKGGGSLECLDEPP